MPILELYTQKYLADRDVIKQKKSWRPCFYECGRPGFKSWLSYLPR